MLIEDWWNTLLQGLPKNLKREKAELLIYTMWNLWKEQNRRVFDGVASLPPRIVTLIKAVRTEVSLAVS